MKPKLIKSEKAYNEALRHVESLMSAKPGTPSFEELELWVHLVEHYEAEHYPIDPPDPVSAIKFRIEQMGLAPKDLMPFIGSKSKVSEILNCKRTLSLAMIRKLAEGLAIPARSLIGAYSLSQADRVAEDGDAGYRTAKRKKSK